MFKRVTLFHFFGFRVMADASWIFLSVLITWTLATQIYPALYPAYSDDLFQFMALITLGGLLFSILVHEVAHAVIAEYYNMPISNITLFIFGGVAEMKGEPSHPKGEFLMAIAGPIMSFLLGLFFMAMGDLYALHVDNHIMPKVLNLLGVMNIYLAIINMIPAFPLDGGRALRAVIWYTKDNLVLATRIASQLGAIFAYLIMGYACYKIVILNDVINGMWIGLLGFFSHASGQYAVRQTENRSLLNSDLVERFMHNNIVTVSPDLTITDLIDQYVYQHYQRHFPVVDREQLVGVVSLQNVLSLDRHKWQWLHVASVMEPVTDTMWVSPTTPAADALDMMQRAGRDHLLVMTKDRKMAGIITLRDLISYLSVSMKVDRDLPVTYSRKGRLD